MNLQFGKLSLKCNKDELYNSRHIFSDINSAILMYHQLNYIHSI